MDYEEYKRKALEPIVNYIESVMASYSKEELEARIKKALSEKESEDERIRKAIIELIKQSSNILCPQNQDKMLAYLEKQKEQKPNVELVQKSWYLEGYHDGKYNNEPKWLIQTGEGGPRYEENQKYGTQKPAD